MAFAYFALKSISAFGSPLMRVSSVYITEGPAKTGALSVIAAITSDFRAIDTLGEATVLFTAIIGILAIARKAGHKKDA